MNVNRILIQCIFNNARRRLFGAKGEIEGYSILDDMAKEVGQITGSPNINLETQGKITQGLKLGIQQSKSIYEILDHLEYAMIEAEDTNKYRSDIRYKA
jgi:hypothetical protein